MAKQYGFEKLEVYQDARIYVRQVYLLTSTFSEKEKYGLCSQLQRAAVSIVSNIAEGVSRNSTKEQIRFIEIAYGSLMEVYCQLYIAIDLKYITQDVFDQAKLQVDKIANKLNALNRSLVKRLTV